MKTKILKSIVTAGLCFFAITVSSQQHKIHENPNYGPDSASRRQCAENLSIMAQYVKINTFEYAYDSWRYCFDNCPKASRNIYIHGARILKYKIENEADEKIQEAWVDTLMLLYDQRIQHFGQPGYVNGMKGIDLIQYRKSAIDEAYKCLEKAIYAPGEVPDESVAIYFMSASYAVLQQGLISADVMIDNYVKVMDLLQEKATSGEDDPRVAQAIESVDNIFAESGAANCESLIDIFTPKFQAEPNNIQLLKKITSLLAQTGCEKSNLYAQTAEKLYKLEPSADAAAKLGGLFGVKEEYDKASFYYTKAIENETDNEKKAIYYYQLAKIAFQTKEYANTRKYCQLAINHKSNFGEAYLLIGTAYAVSSPTCGANDFEKQAVYWAAVDKFIRAKSVDPTITVIADEQIRAYSQSFPNNELAFFNGYTDGQTYTVGCWINETTTVRTTR